MRTVETNRPTSGKGEKERQIQELVNWLIVKSNNYKLNTNEVILLDGTFDHGYTVISNTEFLVIHIPKDIHIIETLLKPRDTKQSQG